MISTRAAGVSVACIHGMDEGGVRFPCGPHMATNEQAGKSVYCDLPIEQRENTPLYRAARELVTRYAGEGGLVLDLGCSDLVASRALTKNQVIGLDLSHDALKQAQENKNGAHVVQADLLRLPISQNAPVRAVMLLEVLEHLHKEEAIQVLRKISALHTLPYLVVSMPIIEPTSIPYWKERLAMLADKNRRPLTGLLDRTHIILEGPEGHKRIFEEAGCRVVKEFRTNWYEGVTGEEWEWKAEKLNEDKSNKRNKRSMERRIKDRAHWVNAHISYKVIPYAIAPNNQEKRREITDKILSVQGLYLLRAK